MSESGPHDHVAAFLALGTVEEITAEVARRGAHLDSHVGQAARMAVDVLMARQITATAERLDNAATRLQRHALSLAWASLAVSVAALAAAIALR